MFKYNNTYKVFNNYKIMASKEQYVIIEKDEPEFPVRELIQSKDGKVVFSVFGQNYFSENVKEINKSYSHPKTGEKITFREPTIAESISLVSYDFENFAKPKIFDPRWLQLGRQVKTQEGVFTNTTEIDESRLKHLLNNTKKVNGIYLINNQTAFIPYDSFKQGEMSSEEFCEQGLARGLEHTSGKKAKNLAKISSKKNYPNGVNVWGWGSLKNPEARISVLISVVGQLRVGDIWDDDGYGFAFGVLDKSD